MSRLFAPADFDFDSDYDYNLHSNPEKCGLKLLGELETGGSYEFCTTLGLQDLETGEVFIAQDSGCSCPVPFEGFKGTGDLIPYESDDQVRRLVDAHHSFDRPLSVTEVHDFIKALRTAADARA